MRRIDGCTQTEPVSGATPPSLRICRGALRRIASGKKSEHHCWRKRATSTAIGHAHGRGHHVAGSVQTWNHVAIYVAHPCQAVSLRPAFRTECTGLHFHRVERPALERSKGCLGSALGGWVAPPGVMGALAAMEVRVMSCSDVRIPALHGGCECVAINAKLVGERRQCGRARHPVRRSAAFWRIDEAVGIQVLLIEHEPAGQVCVAEVGHVLFVECSAECVVVGSLVGKATSRTVDHD